MGIQLSLLEEPKHLIGISGKDSLATALFQTTYAPDIDYEYFFNDNGCELPETYQWLDNIEAKTGWNIIKLGESLEARIHSRNGFLPSFNARYCTKETKIEPLKTRQKSKPTYFYVGIRADEDRAGFIPFDNNICPVFPLREAGITLPLVWAMLEKADLLPPAFFWQKLYEAVCNEYDPVNWESKLKPWQFRMLFAGRSRNNCYFCFYQRRYEWVWLLETHPELFDKAASMEKSDYTWIKGKSLASIKGEANLIFQRQVNNVIKILKGMEKFEVDNAIALTSCGVMCGK